MAFTIDISPKLDFKIIKITDLDTGVFIEIITKGGLLNSWVQSDAKNHFDVIDGNDLTNGINNFESNGFKSAKMNPFCCRLNQGKYDYHHSTHTIEKFYLNEHAIHGIIYDEVFEIVKTDISNENASVWLSYDYQKKDAGYPFNYAVLLKWTFHQHNKISIQTEITNKEALSIPMIDGWHPYFTLENIIDNCTLRFSSLGLLEYDNGLIPTEKIIPNTEFENGKKLMGVVLDNGFVVNPSKPECVLENNEYKLIIKPDHQYTYLQIYTPPHRKSIAIENLSGAPDGFNNKMGLHNMQPHEKWSLETTYQLYYK